MIKQIRGIVCDNLKITKCMIENNFNAYEYTTIDMAILSQSRKQITLQICYMLHLSYNNMRNVTLINRYRNQ